MIDPRDLLFDIIKPTLDHIGLGGPQAEALVLGTALVESGLNQIRQVKGPALGLWQMEPGTAKDIWENFLQFRTDLRLKLLGLLPVWPDNLVSLETNLCYGAAMCRVHYLRAPDALPRIELSELGAFWKKWYNTEKGAGTVDDFKQRASAVMNPSIWRQAHDTTSA